MASTNVNQADPVTGGTALHRAAYLGHVRCVEKLLLRGAERRAQDVQLGCTPLHCAAARGHYDVCMMLLTYPHTSGVVTDPVLLSMKNKEGHTAGDRAQDEKHDRLAASLYHLEAGYDMCTGRKPEASHKKEPLEPGCMPRNAARTVVCLEKWVVVVLFASLTGGAVVVLMYCLDSRNDCRNGDSDPKSNYCQEYSTGIVAAAVCAGMFFVLTIFFIWFFFFGPLRMKENTRTK
eukprot:TRINITY_DN18623_c0_g1_i1.p1 TRINITY_DN18623_c0_g1~~TRINITY_DN18623_c0_g1_i1.p1  ORF type:complete len:234 (-),score=33.88 TRINITY_DN18623_c0_g1_i1:549-1250(-)